MLSNESKPTFLLLRARCPAMTPSQFIGRFVTDPSRPLDNYAPADPSSIIDQEIVSTIEQETSDVIESCQNISVRASLQRLVESGVTTGRSNRTAAASRYIKTYRLQNHLKAFNTLQDSDIVRESLDGPRGLFTYSKGKLYMVIGFKTFSAGTIVTTRHSGGISLQAGFTVPVSASITGLPLNIVDPEIKTGIQRQHAHEHQFTTYDEEIFAVEYRIITQRKLGFWSSTATPSLSSNIMSHRWDNAVYDSAYGDLSEVQGRFDDDSDEEASLEADSRYSQDENKAHKNLLAKEERFDIHETELTEQDLGIGELVLLA